MKRFAISMLLIISLSFLYGFAPKTTAVEGDDYIMMSLDISSNGQIVQSIDFSLNSERLSKHSKSVKEELDFKNSLVKQIETIRNEFLFGFALTYLASPNEEYKINKGVVLTTVALDQENDSVGFKMGFSSLNAWNYYHSSKEGEKEDKKQNIFLNKVESKGVFPFSAQMKISETQSISVGNRYKNLYLSAGQNLSFSEVLNVEYNPIFIYNYSSFNRKLHADSDYSFTDNAGHLHHLWLVDGQSLNENNSINIYYYIINKGVWLIFAITIPLLIMTTAIIIIKLKEKRK